MKIDTTVVLKSVNGKEITIVDEEGIKIPYTIGLLISDIMADPKEKCNFGHAKKYNIMMRFFSEKEVDLDNADLKVIEEMLEKSTTRTSVVVGQAIELLDKMKSAVRSGENGISPQPTPSKRKQKT